MRDFIRRFGFKAHVHYYHADGGIVDYGHFDVRVCRCNATKWFYNKQRVQMLDSLRERNRRNNLVYPPDPS